RRGQAPRSPGQRALEEVEPVLAPERLVAIDEEGRAEDLPLDRLRGQRVVALARGLALGDGAQASAVVARARCHLLEALRIGDVALLGPATAQESEGDRTLALGAPLGRDDEARREVRRRREVLGLERERDAQVLAPALELEHAIGLALRRALSERQAAGDREDAAEIDR